jgi:hypothetical protein
VQKILMYIGTGTIAVVLLFGGGFLAGRLTADKRPSQTSTDHSYQISRLVELTRDVLVRERNQLIINRIDIEQERSSLATERARLAAERKRATSDRTDLTELGQILSNIVSLSETK